MISPSSLKPTPDVHENVQVKDQKQLLSTTDLTTYSLKRLYNRVLPKMATENSNKLKLKMYTSTRKSTFTLVTLQSFTISGVISAEKT